jgi:putative transposase
MNKEINLFYHVVLTIEPHEVAIDSLVQMVLSDYLIIKSKTLECKPIKIGIYNHHVHFIISIPPNLNIIEIVNSIKESLVNYLKKHIKDTNYHCAEEFFISTVSPTALEQMTTLPYTKPDFYGDTKLLEEIYDFLKT